MQPLSSSERILSIVAEHKQEQARKKVDEVLENTRRAIDHDSADELRNALYAE